MPSLEPSVKRPGPLRRGSLSLGRWLVRRCIRFLSWHRKWREAVHAWHTEEADRPLSDPRVRIGRHTYDVRRRTVFLAREEDRVTIGSFCSIAEGVRFVFGNHPVDLVTTFPLRTVLREKRMKNVDAVSRGPITVGNDVWIASDAVILSGVTVGDGAIIGAGSVVTRDVAPYSVTMGVPARHVRYRFNEEQIAGLQKIRWWDWPDEIILANMDVFYDDIDTFIRCFLPRPTA